MSYSKYPSMFTKEQKEALAFLEKFMNGNELIAVLYGAAGTGKTFLLKYFVNNICKVSVCPTAPTHKAVRVVEQMIGKPAKTFHSLHGLRPNVELSNFDISNPQYEPMAEAKIKNYQLVIVDEASMINQSLHILNEQRAKMYNVKILYVGDALQLPPVGENISAIFRLETKFELTSIVRQEKGNPILEIAGLFRDDIVNHTNNGIRYLLQNPKNFNSKGQGYAVLETKEFARSLLGDFINHRYTVDYLKYLSWTNQSVRDWNHYIRHAVMGTASIETLGIGDILTGYQTILDEFQQPVIVNSEDYIIDKIAKRITDEGFEIYICTIRNVYSKDILSNVLIVNHTSKLFRVFIEKLNSYHKTALYARVDRKNKWREYFEFKNKYLILEDIELPVSGYVKRDLYYGYGFTVHKS